MLIGNCSTAAAWFLALSRQFSSCQWKRYAWNGAGVVFARFSPHRLVPHQPHPRPLHPRENLILHVYIPKERIYH